MTINKCKLVVRRFTSGLDHTGDCVNVYPFSENLGHLVEGIGGAFAILEIQDCNETNAEILELLEPNLNPTTHNNIYGLRLVDETSPFYNDLKNKTRVSVTLADVLAHKVTR